MFRPALRALPRATAAPSAAARRCLTTAPPHKTSRSWKNSALRWGLAGGLVYYYNTSNVFADEPTYVTHSPPETSRETETYPSLDAVAEQRRSQARAQSSPSSASTSPVSTESDNPAEDLEQEADQQGAFNEETGEINWDCPCLGGMAHGPCGEQFRAAFSCFVYSQEEPKGIECIDKFKGMQDCFREHPEIYGAELDDTEAEWEGEGVAEGGPAQVGEKVAAPSQGSEVEAQKTERALGAREQVRSQHGEGMSETDQVVPKAWHDTRGANTEK